jgi:hypothetical protein
MPADEARPDDLPQFRSPKRALARSFLLSRNRWMALATDRLHQLKACRVRRRDLQASRVLWQQKALHLQRQLPDRQGLDPAWAQTDTPADAVALPLPPPRPHAAADAADADRPPAPAAATAPDAADTPAPDAGAKKKRRPAGG